MVILFHLSSQTVMMASSPGIMTAAFTSSLKPSNFESSTGFLGVLNLSFRPGPGLISAAIISAFHSHHSSLKYVGVSKYTKAVYRMTNEKVTNE